MLLRQPHRHMHISWALLEPPVATARQGELAQDQSQPDDKVRQTLQADFAIHAFPRFSCTCCAARRLLQEGEACRSSCSIQALAQGAHIKEKMFTDAHLLSMTEVKRRHSVSSNCTCQCNDV